MPERLYSRLNTTDKIYDITPIDWDGQYLRREYLSMMQPTSNLPIKGYVQPKPPPTKLLGLEGRRFKEM